MRKERVKDAEIGVAKGGSVLGKVKQVPNQYVNQNA